jgi:hypothetical protein
MTNNVLKTPIYSTNCSNSTEKETQRLHRANIYDDSRVLDFDNHIKKKRRFSQSDLHWRQIPRANNPTKPLQNKAVNLLSTIVFKLQRKETIILNHNYLSRITHCAKDQNVNLLKQLADILDIKFHAKITMGGAIYYNCYIIKHTDLGRAIIENSALLLAQHHFVGKKSVTPIKQTSTLIEDKVIEVNKKSECAEKIPSIYIYKEEVLENRSKTSNSFNFNPSNSSVETNINNFVETKNSVIEEGVNTAATVYTLKPKKHSNSRKKPTNAETKAKKAKTFKFNQFTTPKPLMDFYPLTAEEGSELQIKSGRDFTLNAQNEILLDMATNRPKLQEHRFKSKAQFMAYMSKALYYEKRDSIQISSINFSIKANETEETAAKRAKAANIESYLNKVEQRAIISRDDETQFRAKLGGTLETKLAYDILSNLKRFYKEGEVFKLIMSREVEITNFAKAIILNQANAVGVYNGVERLEFVVMGNVIKEYHNCNKPELLELPEGIWGDVLRKLIAEYGVDAYKNWFSKLTASIDETTRTIAITATSGMVQDWISSKYGDMMAKIIAGMNFELSSMRV